MDRIIIHGEVLSPFQHIYVYKNGEKIDSLGIPMEGLEEIVFALVEKYNITNIDLAGAKSFMLGIEKSLREKETTQYSTDKISFRYV